MKCDKWLHMYSDRKGLKFICDEVADVRENVQLDVCPLYGGVCGYPSGECYDCPRHGNFRENVRGEWICWYEEIKKDTCTEYIPHCKCSECGTEYDSHTVKFINFCPNCGAKMKKEKNHDT